MRRFVQSVREREKRRGEREEKLLLRVLDGNFSNEKTMTVLRFGLRRQRVFSRRKISQQLLRTTI